MKQGDLLQSQTSIAHGISRDLKLFKGLARAFYNEWPDHVNQLKRKRLRVGQVGYIREKGRFIYYLIIKERVTDGLRFDELRRSLFELKMHMLANNINKISLPKIGSGMNRNSWPDVRMMIEDVFFDTNIKVTIFESDQADAKRSVPRKPEARQVVRDIIDGLIENVDPSVLETENEWLQVEADYENGLIEKKESEKVSSLFKSSALNPKLTYMIYFSD